MSGLATYNERRATASLAHARARASDKRGVVGHHLLKVDARDMAAFADAWALTDAPSVREMLRAAVAMIRRKHLERLERNGIDPAEYAAQRFAQIRAEFPSTDEASDGVGRLQASESRGKPKRR